MGGYASYVWPAYAVFFLVLAWDWIAPLVQRQRVLRDIRARLQRRDARGGAAR